MKPHEDPIEPCIFSPYPVPIEVEMHIVGNEVDPAAARKMCRPVLSLGCYLPSNLSYCFDWKMLSEVLNRAKLFGSKCCSAP